MDKALISYKGIHPGLILAHELEKRGIKKRPFALSIGVLPQTINDLTKERRRFTPAISLKIDRALSLEEGTMLMLQTYYDLKLEKEKSPGPTPELKNLRKILFWDTDINKIDWQKQSKAVISRVFERGNDIEKKTILDFYGRSKIKSVTGRSGVKDNQIPIMGCHEKDKFRPNPLIKMIEDKKRMTNAIKAGKDLSTLKDIKIVSPI